MKLAIKTLAKVPFIYGLGGLIKRQKTYPAGHYYSSIPSRQDVTSYLSERKSSSGELLGINMNDEVQRANLMDYARFYRELPFPENQTAPHRYYYENGWFSYSDAIFLYCFLRKHQPRRIIEVGSGFSSAVMLDTIDGFFEQRPEVTFIEPYPARLKRLLRESDHQHVKLVDKRVQDVPLDTLLQLQSGDLLFIDSSHVVKCGSDLQRIMFEILPRLQPGIFVHFHDVFYPFDYPAEWLTKGRFWNENYFLRAFLSYNSEWSIQFFNHYAHMAFGQQIAQTMPLCVRNEGGSIYLRRETKI